MSTILVADASVVIKWLVEEEDSAAALKLRHDNTVIAPELVFAECSNIVWKKVRRGDLDADHANFIAGLVDALQIEIVSMRGLIARAGELALKLDHPAYDCIYLGLALQRDCRFVTADNSFYRKVQQRAHAWEKRNCVLLEEFV